MFNFDKRKGPKKNPFGPSKEVAKEILSKKTKKK